MIHFKPFKFGKAEWTILFFFIGLAVLAFAIATIPLAATGYGHLTEAWTTLALKYGYWGAFLSALVGSVTVVIVFPYTLVVFFLATQGLNPLWLGLLMGLGATIGQLSGYVIGFSGSHFFKREKPETFEALERIVHARPWMIQWLLFIFAVAPLPDDLLFIPLGMLRYGWVKISIPTLIGKCISGLVVTYSTFVLSGVLDTKSATPATAIVSQLGTFAVLGLIIYLFFRLDWNQMMHRLLDKEGEAPQPPLTTTTV